MAACAYLSALLLWRLRGVLDRARNDCYHVPQRDYCGALGRPRRSFLLYSPAPLLCAAFLFCLLSAVESRGQTLNS